MSFGDYLWQLLPRYFKASSDPEASEGRRWTRALGLMFDDLKEAVLRLRRAWIVRTAIGEALDLIGRDRGLPRRLGETDALYRRRLLGAYDWYAAGGTRKGVIQALQTVVEVPFTIREYLPRDGWRLGSSRLGLGSVLRSQAYVHHFSVVFDRALTADEAERVEKALREAAASHTRWFLRALEHEPPYWQLGRSLLGRKTRLATGG